MGEWFIYLLALIWGGVWAIFLQFVPLGQFLADKRTWLTVVIGVGVDMLLLLLVVEFSVWVKMFLVVAVSSVAIIGRSLANELAKSSKDLSDVKASE